MRTINIEDAVIYIDRLHITNDLSAEWCGIVPPNIDNEQKYLRTLLQLIDNINFKELRPFGKILLVGNDVLSILRSLDNYHVMTQNNSTNVPTIYLTHGVDDSKLSIDGTVHHYYIVPCNYLCDNTFLLVNNYEGIMGHIFLY